MPIRILALLVCASLGFGAEFDRITANSLRGHVSFLASDLLEGRDTPSPGLDVAAEYIASQFRAAGLESLTGASYFQNANFLNVTPNLDGFELSFLHGGNPIRVPPENISVQNTGEVSVRGAKVLKITAGSGAPPPSPEQVRGKVVLIGAKAFSQKTVQDIYRLRASLSGAKPAAMVVLVAGRRGVAPFLRAAEESGPAPVIQGVTADLRKLFDALPEGETDATASLRIAAPKVEPVVLRNVAGLLRGSDPVLKDTYVFVTAHYDHIGVSAKAEGDRINNGADDNASGTAGVIDIAAAFAAAHPRPKRSIVFAAFFGEEKGLLGSRFYTRHPLVPLVKTVADINLEELGRTDDTDGPQVGRLSMTGFGYSDLTAVFRNAARLAGIEMPPRIQNSERFFSGSDNVSFAQKGVPAHTLSVVYIYPDYHRPGDEWQKLDYDNMEKICRMIAVGIGMVANNPVAPKWDAANPKVQDYIRAPGS